MFYSRDKRELPNVLEEAKGPDENGLGKTFLTFRGASTFTRDDQENRMEGEACEAVGTELTGAQGCERAWCHGQLQGASTRLQITRDAEFHDEVFLPTRSSGEPMTFIALLQGQN